MSTKIIVATELPFWRGMSGANQRIAALCRYLSDQGHATVVYYPALLSQSDADLFSAQFPGIALESPSYALLAKRFVRRRLQPILDPGAKKAVVTPGSRRLTAERQAGLERLCARVKPHAIIVEYAMFAYVVEGIAQSTARPVLILDTHDVVSARTQKFLDEGVTPHVQASEEEEAAIFNRFDYLVAIQSAEAKVIAHLAPAKEILIAGHPHPIAPFTENHQDPVRLLFVGATAQHNKIALKGFLDEVWPKLWETHAGQVVLDVVGTVAQTLGPTELPKGVNLIGAVENLDAAYRDCDICINPAFVGSGLKIKNVEALCHGRPLVTTVNGAEGLEDAAHTGAMFVCESYEAMLRDLVKLVEDPVHRSASARAAHAHATEHLTSEKVFAELGACLDDAVARNRGH